MDLFPPTDAVEYVSGSRWHHAFSDGHLRPGLRTRSPDVRHASPTFDHKRRLITECLSYVLKWPRGSTHSRGNKVRVDTHFVSMHYSSLHYVPTCPPTFVSRIYTQADLLCSVLQTTFFNAPPCSLELWLVALKSFCSRLSYIQVANVRPDCAVNL